MALNLSKWIDVSFTETAKSDSLNIARDLLPDKVENWLDNLFPQNKGTQITQTTNEINKVGPTQASNKTLYWIIGGSLATFAIIAILKKKKKI